MVDLRVSRGEPGREVGARPAPHRAAREWAWCDGRPRREGSAEICRDPSREELIQASGISFAASLSSFQSSEALLLLSEMGGISQPGMVVRLELGG